MLASLSIVVLMRVYRTRIMAFDIVALGLFVLGAPLWAVFLPYGALLVREVVRWRRLGKSSCSLPTTPVTSL